MYLEMTFDEWVEKYKPIKDENGEVVAFETYGEDEEFVKTQNPLAVWTLEDAGDGPFIINERHFVNRILYYVTEFPFGEDDTIIVFVEESDEEEEE